MTIHGFYSYIYEYMYMCVYDLVISAQHCKELAVLYLFQSRIYRKNGWCKRVHITNIDYLHVMMMMDGIE